MEVAISSVPHYRTSQAMPLDKMERHGGEMSLKDTLGYLPWQQEPPQEGWKSAHRHRLPEACQLEILSHVFVFFFVFFLSCLLINRI